MKIYASNMKIILTVLAVFIAALAVYYCVGQNVMQTAADKLEEEAMDLSYFKDFSLPLVTGEGEITEEVYKGYKVTVFNGWAPWCGACVGEMPDLDELSKAYADKGLQIIGIVADYNETMQLNPDYDYNGESLAILENLGTSYKNVNSDQAFTLQVMPTMGGAFPCTWAVNEKGEVLGLVSGSRSTEQWTKLFDQWLADAAKGTTEASK